MNRRLTAVRSAPTAIRTAHVRAARAVSVDTDRRVITAVVVPYGETARVTDDGGRTFYEETFQAGGATPADLVAAYSGHRSTSSGVERGELIGRADQLTESDAGLVGEITVARTAEGDRILALADTLGVVHVSAEYDVPRAYQAGEAVVRSASSDGVTIDGVAVILPPQRPAFAGAVGAVRSDTPDDPAPDADPDDPDAGDDTVRSAIPELVRREVARYATTAARTRPVAGPFHAYRSLAELAQAVRAMPADQAAVLSRALCDAYREHTERRAARAWVDQLPAENPGVMTPTWLTTVFGVIDAGRPAISALGGPRNAGTSGLELNWPYYDGDLRTLVGEQVTPKTDIVSVKVSLKKGSADLRTFAGGSDLAAQLVRRSSPSYLATYNTIMNIAYGIVTDDAFAQDLEAAALAGGAYTPAGDTDGSGFRAWLFGASTKVKRATGAPASVVLAATDVFEAIGGSPWLVPPQYGTTNVSGIGDASSLRINVSGLEVTEAPGLTDGTILATNSGAAGWYEDGPFLVTADDVPKLGVDAAVWGLGGTGITAPAGIVKNAAVVPLTAKAKAAAE